MEGESSSPCFICGGSFQVKESPLMRRYDSFKDLRGMVLRLCELLGVEVTPGEWEEVDGDYLMKQTIACDKCFEILRNVERVHELLLKTQRELKVYLDEVESLIIRSETPNLECAFWRSSCFKLRRSVLERVIPLVNGASDASNSLQIEIKEECYGGPSTHEDPNVAIHFDDDDWVSSSSPQTPFHNVLQEAPGHIPENKGDVRESIQTPSVPTGNLPTPPKLTILSSTTRRTRKRKITVIAEEDEVPKDNVPKKIFDDPQPVTRGAKKKAEVALQKYASSGEASDNDEDYNENVDCPSPQQYSSGDNSNDDSNDIKESKPPVKTPIKKAKTETEMTPGSSKNSQKPKTNGKREVNRIKIDNRQWRPFMITNDNVYLYWFQTYVLNTGSHLECQAHKCGFKTEFDFFPSFQRMRAHIEENHRSRKDRQRTPHPCVICSSTYKNREEFLKHFSEAHSEYMKPQRAVCEACLMTINSSHVLVHMYSHKNEDEKADAIANNQVPKRCFRPKLSEITVKKYVCDYENCTYACKHPKNLRRHKQKHLPKELRSDYAVCPECGAHIVREALTSHIKRLHHPETIDRCLMCNLCGRRFLVEHRFKYEAHLRTHTGEKPFLCTECGMSYYHKTALNIHIKNAHPATPKEYPCQWCDMVYTLHGTLRAHWARKHRDKWKPNELTRRGRPRRYLKDKEEIKGEVYGPKQMFPCTICDVICGYRYTLKKHMVMKHGIGEIKKVPQQSRDYYRRKKKEESEDPPEINYEDEGSCDSDYD